MDALSSFGRPRRIEYAVLIDRGLRELPIAADYTGHSVSTLASERVFVRLRPLDTIEGVWAKVHEELDELKDAVASGDTAHAQAELGDVLFTLVNVARWCGLDPEAGLAGTNRRFLGRFSRVEAALEGELAGKHISELEAQWRTAKTQIRTESGDPRA